MTGRRVGKLILSVLLACAIFTVALAAVDKFPTGTFVSGDWSVTFSSDQTYHVTQNSELVVEGNYSVTRHQAIFKDTQGRYACNA
jgi:hypothetical protein